MKTDYVALAGRISEWLLDLARLVDRAESLLDKGQRTGDDGYLDGVALNLHGFYAGVEHMFEDIARILEKSVPEGAEWHRDLLLQMSAKVSNIRPAVISRQTRYCLDEYRGFRHVVRNVYTFNLKPARLTELTKQLRDCYEGLNRDINDFAGFLQTLSQDSDD
ncbi:MAG: hypothetical protein V1736_01115 [Pseudomonadota bacterium]